MDNRLHQLALNTKGFMPDNEGMLLHEYGYLAGKTMLGPALEIGSYCGRSTIYLGAGLAKANATLFSLDHHRGSEELQVGCEHHDPSFYDPKTGMLETLFEWRSTVTKSRLTNIVGIIGESGLVSKSWGSLLSLLFIDGGHSAFSAHQDYDCWSKFVAKGGYLAIHDVFENEADGGRPPYEIYLKALDSNKFAEVKAEGSLRILRRVP